MEVKLLEAAIAGDPLELERLINEDPDILNRVITGGAAEETPLHIAAQLGHTKFVAMIGSLKPEFAHAKNSEGRCPLHLASAMGHVETVAELLEINSDVCFVRDQDGRSPLHIAAMKGRVQVLEKLADKKIKAAWVLADCGQPILHLCVNHNQFDVLKPIIERVKDKAPEKLIEFVNLKDEDDNTILHLLAAKAQHEVIEFLFPEDQSKNVFKVNVNAINQQGYTALDVLHQNCGPLDRMRIKFFLDGAKRAADIPGSKSYEIKRSMSMWDSLFERKEGEKIETRDALMVVAILIATATFQAQMSPPGGVWQQDGNITTSSETDKVDFYYAGQSVMGVKDPITYSWLTTFNIVGFVASLILILLLVSGFTLRRKVSTLALTVTTWIAIVSMFVIFGVSLSTLKPTSTDNESKTPKDTTRAPTAAPSMGPSVETTAMPVTMTVFSGFPWLVALMLLLVLLVLTSGIKYIWKHLHKGITRSVKRGFKYLFCCPCFWKSSERDSEGRADMNA